MSWFYQTWALSYVQVSHEVTQDWSPRMSITSLVRAPREHLLYNLSEGAPSNMSKSRSHGPQALFFHDVPQLPQVGLSDGIVRLQLQGSQIIGLRFLSLPLRWRIAPRVHEGLRDTVEEKHQIVTLRKQIMFFACFFSNKPRFQRITGISEMFSHVHKFDQNLSVFLQSITLLDAHHLFYLCQGYMSNAECIRLQWKQYVDYDDSSHIRRFQ